MVQVHIDVLSDKAGRETGTSIPNQQSSYYTKGFDGYSYPMPNDQGQGWPQPQKDWVLGMDPAPLL